MTNSTPNLEELTADWSPSAKERALREFRALSSTNRQAWFCDRGRACDGRPHEGYNFRHARADQYPPVGNDWLVWAVLSGRGCVAPGTRVFNPGTTEHVPIADIPLETQVLTFDGPAPTTGAPFRKGFDNLWQVKLSTGHSVTVTAGHQFLTRHGWEALSEMSVGSTIAVGGPRLTGRGDSLWETCGKTGNTPVDRHNHHYRSDFEASLGLGFEEGFARPIWAEIDSITWSHHGEFWDLTVPGPHHYSAEGIWHHNSGKTRLGAEWVRKISERVGRTGMIGRRGTDVRATMVEGPSGLIYACENAGISFEWQPSKREFTFPNGGKVFGYSAEEPDSLRGPQHGALWLDEPAHMPLIKDVWDNAMLGLRLPGLPGGAKALVTTTPTATPFMKELVKDSANRIVRVSTYANLENLDPAFRRQILQKYEGTRLGRQELYGEILEDIEGALWSGEMFRVSDAEPAEMERIVVGIDPAGSSNRRSDETGIVAVGKRGDEYFVLADRTGKYSPHGWAEAATGLYDLLQADAIVAEKNYGGDMVRSTIEHALERSRSTARIIVATAMRSKQVRAEPVVGLYEQGRVFHLRGVEALENEMVQWVPGVGDSPNRIDALVWGVTELAGGRHGAGSFAAPKGDLPPVGHAPSRRGGKKSMIRGIFG